MKANELFEQIHSRKIKEETKIKVINELTGNWITTISYKNGRLNWQAGEFDTSFLCNIDIDFKVIEEKKEIEELKNLIDCLSIAEITNFEITYKKERDYSGLYSHDAKEYTISYGKE